MLSPSLGDLPDPGIEHGSLKSSALAGVFFTTRATWEALLLSHFSRVQLCETPWTAAHQASPSMGFSRQEQWSEEVIILITIVQLRKGLKKVNLLA